MKRPIVAVLLVAASLVTPAPASADPGLRLVSDVSLSDRLREIVVDSPALERQTTMRVLLPAGYDPEAVHRYPVLYLLHGAFDDYTSWTRETDVEALTADQQLIVVMPDGGRGGWYSDWYNNGFGGPPRWETYHIDELISWADETYTTIPTRSGRAIAGLSMGGFGTYSYAARHPDLFVAAASFSGAVDSNLADPVAPAALDAIAAPDPPPNSTPVAPPGSVWGQRTTEEERWRSHNPWDLAENLADTQLTIRTGNGQPGGPYGGDYFDPLEFGVHEMSVSLHERLVALGVDHVWDDYGAGNHGWPYWERGLHQTLPDMMSAFGTPDPVPFSYVSGEPSISVYDFEVTFDRDVREFSRLASVRPEGFTLTGTGLAHVTTASWYAPGADYEVSGVGAVAADPAGRLAFEVDLGASNVAQQHTLAADVLQAALGDDYFRTVEVSILPR
jgi:S-formylglutathione hydrolase FrmB